jgi:excisionase family DNA binding protein
MTVKEAAEIFFENTVSKELLYREIRNGNIPHVKLSEGKVLLDADTLETWWQSKLAESTQQAEPKEEISKNYGKLRRIAE